MPGLLGEVEIKRNAAASQNILDLEVLNTPEGLQVMLDFASSRYNKVSIEMYGKIMDKVIQALIKLVDSDSANVKTVLKQVYNELGMGNIFSKLFAFNWLNK